MVKKKTQTQKIEKLLQAVQIKDIFHGSPRPILRNFTVNLLSLMSDIISPWTKLGNQNGVNSFEGEDGQK